MAAIFSWFLIPAAAALAAGNSNWLTSNFSVAGSESPGSFFLILWALLTGGFFRFLIRRAVSMAGAGLASKREAALTDLALLLLLVSVFIPYRPGKMKLLAAVQRRYSFYRCLHPFDAYAFQRFVIQEKVKDLLIHGQRAASQKLMVA